LSREGTTSRFREEKEEGREGGGKRRRRGEKEEGREGGGERRRRGEKEEGREDEEKRVNNTRAEILIMSLLILYYQAILLISTAIRT
jgi:hypothetical protein